MPGSTGRPATRHPADRPPGLSEESRSRTSTSCAFARACAAPKPPQPAPIITTRFLLLCAGWSMTALLSQETARQRQAIDVIREQASQELLFAAYSRGSLGGLPSNCLRDTSVSDVLAALQALSDRPAGGGSLCLHKASSDARAPHSSALGLRYNYLATRRCWRGQIRSLQRTRTSYTGAPANVTCMPTIFDIIFCSALEWYTKVLLSAAWERLLSYELCWRPSSSQMPVHGCANGAVRSTMSSQVSEALALWHLQSQSMARDPTPTYIGQRQRLRSLWPQDLRVLDF